MMVMRLMWMRWMADGVVIDVVVVVYRSKDFCMNILLLYLAILIIMRYTKIYLVVILQSQNTFLAPLPRSMTALDIQYQLNSSTYCRE
jgi:hypothetical protein